MENSPDSIDNRHFDATDQSFIDRFSSDHRWRWSEVLRCGWTFVGSDGFSDFDQARRGEFNKYLFKKCLPYKIIRKNFFIELVRGWSVGDFAMINIVVLCLSCILFTDARINFILDCLYMKFWHGVSKIFHLCCKYV